MRDLEFTRPTPIQSDAIPTAMSGRDVVACAQTGSGKTAAFLLPLLHQLLTSPRRGTSALVLAPTRELAAQILEEFRALARHTRITGAAVYGGVGMRPQEDAFRSGVNILIATPGRLLDHLKEGYASLDNISYFVLDEADRMLDMGFLPDIRRVLAQLPSERQTLLFSATMPAPIKKLAAELLRNPASVNLERQAAPAAGITQAVYEVPEEGKSALLLELLRRGVMNEALVFTRTKHRTNRLWEYLTREGIAAARIHGNRSQAQRTDALDGFKAGRYRVLVATDIAARGIDVEALGHVVNFDVPVVPEDYIHRVGRTARAELTGEAYTFVSPKDSAEIRAIEKAIGGKIERAQLEGWSPPKPGVERFEVPLAERIAAIRTRKAEERARAKAKEERRSELARAGAGGGSARVRSGEGTRSSSSGRSRDTAQSSSDGRSGEGSRSRTGRSSGGSSRSAGDSDSSRASVRTSRTFRGAGSSGGGRSGGRAGGRSGGGAGFGSRSGSGRSGGEKRR